MRAPRDNASDRIGITLMNCLELRQPTTGCTREADQKDIKMLSGNRNLREA
ncbi:hypothetical protein J121_2943 [Qipengyuania citrea LAMA 915]|jgi:hypothetical protein|uniref:Uncharacterized protein n=1 Tax=Qipengyuania citrea LAMA 915 TaxID=1306953 RepID=A0A0L1KH11_9SPHN|nr:hypothetical protein J121_2943 [Qipengyuania citrea LAMA 915]